MIVSCHLTKKIGLQRLEAYGGGLLDDNVDHITASDGVWFSALLSIHIDLDSDLGNVGAGPCQLAPIKDPWVVAGTPQALLDRVGIPNLPDKGVLLGLRGDGDLRHLSELFNEKNLGERKYAHRTGRHRSWASRRYGTG